MRIAVIAGATGLVGSTLLDQILADERYARVIALSRRDLPLSHPRLEKRIVANLKHPDDALGGVQPTDVFCCLGTTMAVAGSKEKFYEVDFEYPLALARVTLALGAERYLLISSLGADPKSKVFYSRVKGDVEQAISTLGFRVVHIFRPSLLLGPRDEKRTGENLAKALYRVLNPLIPRKYKAIEAHAVARAMLAAGDDSGVFVHESDVMQDLAATK